MLLYFERRKREVMILEKIQNKDELIYNLHILQDSLNSDNTETVAKDLIASGRQFVAVEDDVGHILFAPVKYARYKNYHSIEEYNESKKKDDSGEYPKDNNESIVTGGGAYDWFCSILENKNQIELKEKFDKFCKTTGIEPRKVPNDERKFISFFDKT